MIFEEHLNVSGQFLFSAIVLGFAPLGEHSFISLYALHPHDPLKPNVPDGANVGLQIITSSIKL